ncbi:hypothetical protein GGI07_001482 [Coemansia sp. Benny D115]|nr:hypothetical protein GGI07_001482 [Coemansia sp. Benny D115]
MSSPQPAHSAPGDIKRPQSTSATLSQGESYSTSLSNFLEIGYDDGRRVINMPNPLESLSLDIPINPPVQPMVGVDLLGGQRLSKDAMMYVTMGHQQNAFVAMSENPVLHPNDTANILGFHSSNLCALPQASVAGSVDHTKVEQHLRIGDASQLASLGIASTRNARRVVSKALGGAQDVRLLPTDTAQRPKSRRGRPPLAGGSKRSASANVGKAHLRMGSSGSETALSTRLQAAATSAMAVGGGSCVQSPCFDNGSAQSSLCHTPSLTATSSALLPHRVDRQLAVAARPLLFVRPREENEPLRRRKRRCVSSNEAATSGNSGANRSASSELGSAQPVSASELSGSGAVAMLGEDGQNNLQWQRISEQRRRDAMRENFDLLKRMLPQAYMASDDGRELARPVLLARFLRWVDDTLIEMEGLKTEVARLKLDNNKNTGPDSVSES